MEGAKRLGQGKTRLEIIRILIDSHPDGKKRSDLQKSLRERLGVGNSIGGVNRHLKMLREVRIIDWNQDHCAYVLPKDNDSQEYFKRIVQAIRMSTDECYFLFKDMKNILSNETRKYIDDYIGQRYDNEMMENLSRLDREYGINEMCLIDEIRGLLIRHNRYVRLRLFRTMNECFLNDLGRLPKSEESSELIRAYAMNMKSVESQMFAESDAVFSKRLALMNHLGGKRVSKRLKFLIRFCLNHVRPSHIYDNLI